MNRLIFHPSQFIEVRSHVQGQFMKVASSVFQAAFMMRQKAERQADTP